MAMRLSRRVVPVAALMALSLAGGAHAAAPPQGYQTDAAFARSYAGGGVQSVSATTERVSCYGPEVLYLVGLDPTKGYPDGGGTACTGATTGESVGPYSSQDRTNRSLVVKEHSESDLHVDPTDASHVVGVSKWVVNAEGYNHLTGFFESFDGGLTWPAQGHVPGYEGWTDNSDPVAAFDPWGNLYTVVLPYMFDYDASGRHRFLSPAVNPALPRSGLGIAVRPKGATSADTWLTAHGNRLDLIATTPFEGANVFDKQWIAIDTNPRSAHRGRVYVAWAIGGDDDSLRIYSSHADARPDGTHTDWTGPRLALRQAPGFGDNGAIPRVAPDGTVWLATTTFSRAGAPFTISVTSSRNGGVTWSPRRIALRGQRVDGYENTTFRSAFGLAFAVGPRKTGGSYPLYIAYEDATASGTGLFARASFDGGRHWRRPVRIDDDRGPGEALQPNLAVSPRGTVSVAFYDRRLPCPGRASVEAARAGLQLDPRQPFGRQDYCVNTAVQFYRPSLRPVGRNVRLSAHTWDPQLSSPRPACICSAGGFIGDYFGVDSAGGFTYAASVTTANVAGENPGFHQQQLVSKIRTP